jgi:phosphinothricin acetyltransferase
LKPNIKIRFAEINDLPVLVDIFNQAILARTTGYTQEFSIDERMDWFNHFNQKKYPLYVAIIDEKPIGYCSLSPYREGRAAMSKIAEVSFFMDKEYQGQGFGSQLLGHVINDCERIGIETLLAILLETNPASIRLLEKFSFKRWGYFPEIIDFGDEVCSHLIYGLKLK